MIKKILFGILLCVFYVNGAKYHQDSRGVEIHTPFRWIVADNTARLALSVVAADTQKFCFQLADTTIWVLIDDSPKKWAWVTGKKADSLKIRSLNTDSATIPVFKGNETHRGDSFYFAGIGKFVDRLYLSRNDTTRIYAGDISISNPGTALKVVSSDTTQQVEIAMCQNDNIGVRRWGGYWVVERGNQNLKWVSRTNNSDSTRVTINNRNGFAGFGIEPIVPLHVFRPSGTVNIYAQADDIITMISSQKANGAGVVGTVSNHPTRIIANNSTKIYAYPNDSVVIVGVCISPEFNSGNGNCEIYPTISGTFPCTLKTSDVTVQQIATAYWTKSKDVFTCSMPRIVGTSNSTTLKIYCKFPYNPIQLSGSTPDEGLLLLASDNNQPVAAYVEVPELSGYIQVFRISGAFTNTGTKGVYAPFTVKYITEN